MADIRLGCMYVTKRRFWKSTIVVLEADGQTVKAIPHGRGEEFTISKSDFERSYEHDPNCLYCIGEFLSHL